MMNRSTLLIILTSLTLVACGASARHELSKAEKALEQARDAGAEHYASATYHRANDAYQDSLAQIDASSDVDQAKFNLAEAEALADDAERETNEMRDIAREVAQRNIREAELVLQITGAVLRNGASPEMVDLTEERLELLGGQLRQAQRAFESADYAEAGLIASDVTEAIAQLSHRGGHAS